MGLTLTAIIWFAFMFWFTTRVSREGQQATLVVVWGLMLLSPIVYALFKLLL